MTLVNTPSRRDLPTPAPTREAKKPTAIATTACKSASRTISIPFCTRYPVCKALIFIPASLSQRTAKAIPIEEARVLPIVSSVF